MPEQIDRSLIAIGLSAPRTVTDDQARWRLAVLLGMPVYTLALLAIEAHWPSRATQAALAVTTWAYLLWSARRLSVHERVLVGSCVVFSTAVELFGAVLWGLYRYRFHNLPLFVPPGHGMILVYGLVGARSPFIERHGELLARATLLAGSIWAALGVSLLVPWTGRLDVHGLLYLPALAWSLFRDRDRREWLVIILATTALELAGAYFGTWEWLAIAPVTRIPSGNPPCLIGACYCLINAFSRALAEAFEKAVLDESPSTAAAV